MSSALGINAVGLGVVLGVLVWLALLGTAIALLVKGSRGRKVVPRVAVEGRVVQPWQLGGNPHTIDFDYPLPDGTWRRGRGRLPMFFTPYADGQPITVHVNPADPTDVVVDPERGGNSRAMFAGLVLLCLSLAVLGFGVVAVVILSSLPT